MNTKKKIRISREKAIDTIAGKDPLATLRMCELTFDNCVKCKPEEHHHRGMTIDEYFTNDLGDLILEGTCDKCGEKAVRYLEIDESEEEK